MSDGKENIIELENQIQNKIDKISRILNIPRNKVLYASILHGFNNYHLPLQKYYNELEVEEQPVKEEQYQPLLSDLRDQIELSFRIIQNIDDFEAKFEDKHPFGSFPNLQERHYAFIKFSEILNKPKDIQREEPPEITIAQEILEEPTSKEELEKEEDETPPIQGILRWLNSYIRSKIHGVADVLRLMIVLILSFTANFFVFWGLSWWQPILFDIGYHLRYYPIFLPFMIILIGFIIIIISVIVGKILYIVFHKLQKKKSGKIT